MVFIPLALRSKNFWGLFKSSSDGYLRKANSILSGNWNLGLSYPITTVIMGLRCHTTYISTPTIAHKISEKNKQTHRAV